MIIDFHKCYGGGGSSSGVTPQEVQAQIDSALTPYWESGETKDYVDEAVSGISLEGYYTSAQTEDAISAATSGKADAASVRARNSDIPLDGPVYIPKWNEEGIITGDGTDVYMQPFYVNGVASAKIYKHQRLTIPPIYAPVSAGTAGDILVSSGPGNAPVWSAMTFITSADVETQIEAKGYITSADTADFLDDEDGLVISSAINDLRGLIEVISAATPEVDLSGYYDSAQTEQAITSKNYVTSAQVETQIAANNYITSGQVKDQIEAYDYATVSQLPVVPTSNTAFTNDAKYVNSAETKAQIEAYNYVTSADVETQILSKNYITSADTVDFLDDEDGLVISTALNNLDGKIEDVSDHLDEVERITASAYTELHDGILDLDDRVDDVETSLASKVSSSTVSTIWKGTQAQYDAITTKDPATFYIIVSSN